MSSQIRFTDPHCPWWILGDENSADTDLGRILQVED